MTLGMSLFGRRILVAEDEASLRLTLFDRLSALGAKPIVAEDGERALALAGEAELLILDLSLPKIDGYEVCRRLRQEGKALPILMLTARSEVVDKIVGFRLGADDYVTKPFEMAELMVRVEALLRRSGEGLQGAFGDAFQFGDVVVDLRGEAVSVDGRAVELSALEYRLLKHFIAHRGEVLTRQRLLDEVWGYDKDVFSRTVDVHVASLRQKIEPTPSHPRYLVTVHGRGYKFLG